MKCKKCKAGITSPVVKTTNIDGTPITSSTCPVCGENLDGSKKYWVLLIILIIGICLASKYLSWAWLYYSHMWMNNTVVLIISLLLKVMWLMTLMRSEKTQLWFVKNANKLYLAKVFLLIGDLQFSHSFTRITSIH